MHIHRSMPERSCMLGHTHRNKQGHMGIPMIATTRYDGSRPPIPIDRDQFEGAVGHSW
jgi:hypothetical protein